MTVRCFHQFLPLSIKNLRGCHQILRMSTPKSGKCPETLETCPNRPKQVQIPLFSPRIPLFSPRIPLFSLRISGNRLNLPKQARNTKFPEIPIVNFHQKPLKLKNYRYGPPKPCTRVRKLVMAAYKTPMAAYKTAVARYKPALAKTLFPDFSAPSETYKS